MLEFIPEPAALAFVLLGALVAGFITGFAGFGTGLVASGLWFHALPAALVPPLVALSSVAAQLVGLATIIDARVFSIAALCLPMTMVGAWIGARVYSGVSEAAFRRVVLVLLLGSGAILVIQGL